MTNQIKIRMSLKKTQYTGPDKWKCTINGESRLVTSNNIELYADTFTEAVNKFDINEVFAVDISWADKTYK